MRRAFAPQLAVLFGYVLVALAFAWPLPLHLGTHVDALCHAWCEDRLYNGFPGDTIRSTTGAARLGVEKMPPLVTRGVLLDLTMHGPLPDGRAIEIPVVGIDFIVADVTKPSYVFIEANERPGLANHEPQPTAERFIDLLFPLSRPNVPQFAREVDAATN